LSRERRGLPVTGLEFGGGARVGTHVLERAACGRGIPPVIIALRERE